MLGHKLSGKSTLRKSIGIAYGGHFDDVWLVRTKQRARRRAVAVIRWLLRRVDPNNGALL